MTTTNKTKAELLEIIKQKENDILDLKEDLRQLEKCRKYDDVTDEIKDVYDKLMKRSFKSSEALEIVKTMITVGDIRKEKVYRNAYVSYRR